MYDNCQLLLVWRQKIFFGLSKKDAMPVWNFLGIWENKKNQVSFNDSTYVKIIFRVDKGSIEFIETFFSNFLGELTEIVPYFF